MKTLPLRIDGRAWDETQPNGSAAAAPAAAAAAAAASASNPIGDIPDNASAQLLRQQVTALQAQMSKQARMLEISQRTVSALEARQMEAPAGMDELRSNLQQRDDEIRDLHTQVQRLTEQVGSDFDSDSDSESDSDSGSGSGSGATGGSAAGDTGGAAAAAIAATTTELADDAEGPPRTRSRTGALPTCPVWATPCSAGVACTQRDDAAHTMSFWHPPS